MPETSPRIKFDRGTLQWNGGKDETPPGDVERWTYEDSMGEWVSHAYNYPSVVGVGGFADEVGNWQEKPNYDEANLFKLRKDQKKAHDAWLAANGRGMIYMPTGTGKTEVALHLMLKLRVPTLIVSPVKALMYQWHRRIKYSLGVEAGIIGDNSEQVRPVSVTTYHSACFKMKRLGNQFQFIIFDEVHHLLGPVRADAAKFCAAPYRLGLTATPPGGYEYHEETAKLIGPPAYWEKIHSAAGNTLAEYTIIPIKVALEDDERAEYERLNQLLKDYMAKKNTQKRGYNFKLLGRDANFDKEAARALRAYHTKNAIESNAIQKLGVLEEIFQLQPERPTIIFCSSNAAARAVTLKFMIPCILSNCLEDERDEIFTGFEQGVYKALVGCKILNEGVDLPSAKVGVILGGTGSQAEAEQRLGRILRKTGEVPAVLYDVYCGESAEARTALRRRQIGAYQDRIRLGG